ncbi:hypothetical protein [Nocardioides rubriscoriae]|uniref:hypothetical protein n=1 Tax=Nocardioides rubriscoriae TaxID=642762 RepID=UPI0011DF7B0A|nr:hypothetical protein [Nocardioides rubriscoriae]
MGAEAQGWVQLAAQAVEAMVWLALSLWCLERLRAHVWARLAGVGAALLLVPAATLTAGRAQAMLGAEPFILQGYVTSTLPTAYAVMKVVAAGLLLAAVLVGRGAPRPTPA